MCTVCVRRSTNPAVCVERKWNESEDERVRVCASVRRRLYRAWFLIQCLELVGTTIERQHRNWIPFEALPVKRSSPSCRVHTRVHTQTHRGGQQCVTWHCLIVATLLCVLGIRYCCSLIGVSWFTSECKGEREKEVGTVLPLCVGFSIVFAKASYLHGCAITIGYLTRLSCVRCFSTIACLSWRYNSDFFELLVRICCTVYVRGTSHRFFVSTNSFLIWGIFVFLSNQSVLGFLFYGHWCSRYRDGVRETIDSDESQLPTETTRFLSKLLVFHRSFARMYIKPKIIRVTVFIFHKLRVHDIISKHSENLEISMFKIQ